MYVRVCTITYLSVGASVAVAGPGPRAGELALVVALHAPLAVLAVRRAVEAGGRVAGGHALAVARLVRLVVAAGEAEAVARPPTALGRALPVADVALADAALRVLVVLQQRVVRRRLHDALPLDLEVR